MHKKLTITMQDLAAAYRDMAADESREAEAHEWAEATVQDVADEARSADLERVEQAIRIQLGLGL